MRFRALAALAGVCAPAFWLGAQEPPEYEKPKIRMARITSPIKVDGDLSDPGWAEATVVPLAYEINPGDNTTPAVKTMARIGYDDKFFYVSFECEDPNISKLRAPYVDRDGINDDQDYVGILLDVENQNHSAIDFWIGPTGIQADSVFFEGTFTEDFGPDYFWQSAGWIGPSSWNAEVAIPLSSLRYPEKDPQDWALALYRTYPRDRNYQFYSVRVPRGSSCFLCNSATVEGITGLPQGAHWVLAPYGAMTNTKYYGADGPADDNTTTLGQVGLDAKWLPNADTIVDATINPDFSQIEADTAQISVNERFALFYPEKRPFFLEHVDLLQTPIQAVYTRTITQPLWGARLTGKTGGTNYTALVASDEGGGTVIIPGPVFSETAPQNYESTVAIARVRQDLGDSYRRVLATGRVIKGGGYNTVVGGDFHWQAGEDDVINGQYLYSFSQNPDRPDLYPLWLGQKQSGFGVGRGVGALDVDLGVEPRIRGLRPRIPGRRRVRAAGRLPRGLGGAGIPVLSERVLLPAPAARGRQLPGRPRGRPDLAKLLSGDCVPGAVEPARRDRLQLRGRPDRGPDARIRRRLVESPGLSLAVRPAHHVRRKLGRAARRLQRARRKRRHADAHDDDPADGAPRAGSHRRTPVDRRDRRRARGPPLHRDRRPRQGDLRLQLPDVLPGDRPVHRDDARSPPLDVSRSWRRSRSSPGRPCSPTSSTGRPCSYVGYGDNRSLFEGSTTYLQPQNRQFLIKVSYAFQR